MKNVDVVTSRRPKAGCSVLVVFGCGVEDDKWGLVAVFVIVMEYVT
jgi:hypothetical protein